MLLFVCGWPACGKSYFGEWLEVNHDFRHLDLEDPDFDDRDLHALWARHMPASAPQFVAALLKQHRRWVLTWGAPADCMPHFEALRTAGFESWFLLAGNEQRSRLEWLQREREKDPDVRPVAWERRRDQIHRGARDLRRFFRDRCIESLTAQGERMSCEELAERMGVTPRREARERQPSSSSAHP